MTNLRSGGSVGTAPPASPAIHQRGADTQRTHRYVAMLVDTEGRADPRVMRSATALASAGAYVAVVDVARSPSGPRHEVVNGVSFRHVMMPSWYVPARFKPLFLMKLAALTVRGWWQLVRTPADVYHAHDHIALTACYLAARLRRKPLVYDSHELPLVDLAKYARWRRLHALSVVMTRCLIARCSAVIVVSPPIAPEFHRRYGGPFPVLVRNIPIYQPPTGSDRIRQFLGLSDEVRIALYQGIFLGDRSLHVLVHAARFLDKRTVIVMIGRGPEKSQLEGLVAREGLFDRVFFVPFVHPAELLGWTASADLGLYLLRPDYSPSIHLSLGNKLFEYLMAGLPVLSSDLPATVELIEKYKVGRVVPTLDPEVIARVITDTLDDQDELAQMRANALAAARSDLRWDVESGRLVELYERILGPLKTQVPAPTTTWESTRR